MTRKLMRVSKPHFADFVPRRKYAICARCKSESEVSLNVHLLHRS